MTIWRALIVEDDRDLADLFHEALRAAEFETHILHDGKDVMPYLADHHPDLVILDLHLPHVTGADLLIQIREQAALHRLKVIVTTADGEMARWLEEQADLVLLKPVSFIQLRDMAARMMTESG